MRRNFAPGRKFTVLDARITEEEADFTVSVRMRNHLSEADRAWGVEKAASIEIASNMIRDLVAQFSIPKTGISIKIVMNKFRDGTIH